MTTLASEPQFSHGIVLLWSIGSNTPFRNTQKARLLPSRRNVLLSLFELLNIFRRKLRTIDLDGQLVELGGEWKRRLIVLVVYARERIRADVEALVPLQDHGQGPRHLLR